VCVYVCAENIWKSGGGWVLVLLINKLVERFHDSTSWNRNVVRQVGLKAL
jgi:hypothetical protein